MPGIFNRAVFNDAIFNTALAEVGGGRGAGKGVGKPWQQKWRQELVDLLDEPTREIEVPAKVEKAIERVLEAAPPDDGTARQALRVELDRLRVVYKPRYVEALRLRAIAMFEAEIRREMREAERQQAAIALRLQDDEEVALFVAQAERDHDELWRAVVAESAAFLDRIREATKPPPEPPDYIAILGNALEELKATITQMKQPRQVIRDASGRVQGVK